MKLIKELNEIEQSEALENLSSTGRPYTATDALIFLAIFKVALTIIFSGVKLITGPKADAEIDKFLAFINK